MTTQQSTETNKFSQLLNQRHQQIDHQQTQHIITQFKKQFHKKDQQIAQLLHDYQQMVQIIRHKETQIYQLQKQNADYQIERDQSNLEIKRIQTTLQNREQTILELTNSVAQKTQYIKQIEQQHFDSHCQQKQQKEQSVIEFQEKIIKIQESIDETYRSHQIEIAKCLKESHDIQQQQQSNKVQIRSVQSCRTNLPRPTVEQKNTKPIGQQRYLLPEREKSKQEVKKNSQGRPKSNRPRSQEKQRWDNNF